MKLKNQKIKGIYSVIRQCMNIPLTELRKLNELRQSGVLSEEEYNKAKARVMEK